MALYRGRDRADLRTFGLDLYTEKKLLLINGLGGG
jgi:hypothetical protein